MKNCAGPFSWLVPATGVRCSILYLLILQFSVLNALKCEKGFFGDICEYQCHCHGSKDNCLENGTCTQGCASDWIGPTCQNYARDKWVFSKEYESKNGSISCPNNNLTSIVIDIWYSTTITWMRVWTNGNASEMGEDLHIILDGLHMPCSRPEAIPIKDGVFDLYCPLSTLHNSAKVEIEAKHLNRWCKVALSLGRNLALKRATNMSGEEGQESTNGSKLVDGDLQTCSSTELTAQNASWTVYFDHPIDVAEIGFRFPKGYYMEFVDIEFYGGNTSLDVYTIGEIDYTISVYFNPLCRGTTHITIRHSEGKPQSSIKLCEVQVFGECPSGKIGRCDTECNCADKSESCYASKGCLSGCATGYFGKSCTEPCPSGTWGSRCQHKCSHYCNMSVCDTGTGACSEGCIAPPQFCEAPSMVTTIHEPSGSVLSVLIFGFLLFGVIGAVAATIIPKATKPLAVVAETEPLWGFKVEPKKSRSNSGEACTSEHQLNKEGSSVDNVENVEKQSDERTELTVAKSSGGSPIET